ncbi:CheR family methyltransferase [Pelagibaculum spongiae]|uniref:protein-glutamate O-methyltransferase n=1 Tax=Pelagibaculum spongiae TaxID=2080658 RepID=A0A2V1GV24_9GAMM|nr:protein-glutamate O-methyltransferase CheR [Pelagibaculum spongiae]PVZ66748.1 chemotaxis protein CheR [Pelagibaculum spongiae]
MPLSQKSLETGSGAKAYQEFRQYLERVCGIELGANKAYLVSSRLSEIVRQQNMTSLQALVDRLKLGRDLTLQKLIVDAMTTNETQWFRDGYPFEKLKKMLEPSLAKNTISPLRIWSAACSSGQEPYSIAMVLSELKASWPALNRPIQIVATDISDQMLGIAKKGVYNTLAIRRGLPVARLNRFFKEVDNGHMEISADVRKMVSFERKNLLDSFVSMGQFDLIFCRNVLIYFTPENKADIIRRMAAQIKPNGYFVPGSSESLTDFDDMLTMQNLVPGIVYQKK